MIWLFEEDTELVERANLGPRGVRGAGWKRPREVRVLEGWKAGEKGGNDAIMLDIFYSKKG